MALSKLLSTELYRRGDVDHSIDASYGLTVVGILERSDNEEF